jgi:tRNA A-37 threonylcarbamoyl transferase component Bud32
MNELDLFAAAIGTADSGERLALLDRECAGRPELRTRLDQLIAAHFQSNVLLDAPAVDQTIDHSPSSQPTITRRPAAEAIGTLIAGRYKLLEEIGEGGMGTVWVAEQTQPVKRKVALKLIKPGMDSRQVLARFEAERQALAVMDHPNIAKVLDGGLTDAGRPFFVMEYVKGVPITEYCDAARLSVPERLHLFAQVCQAVQHAHQKGIIHRDLKPSNLLVAPYDDKPVPKIIDFGLAKAMHQSLTERTLHTAHETVLGTPLYMSPEQAQLNNLDVDTRSDIYSLGVLLYELLTGTTPLEKARFKQAAWDEIRRLIREDEPPRPSMRLSSTATLPSLAAVRQSEPARLPKLVRGDLDWIVMKALEKDRTRRYETANGFAMDIQRYLSGEPVQAAPPSAAYRMRKFARKHRAGLATAAAIALLLVAGIAVSSWQAFRATRAEGRALAAASAERTAKNAEADERRKAETAAAAEKAARQRAETAEADAKHDLAKFEAINAFLTNDLLTQAEPANNAVEDKVTLLEILDRAAEKVETRFADQPELEQSLRLTIMKTYHGLASWKKAETQARAVLDLLQKRKPDSSQVHQAESELAHMLHHAGQWDAGALELAETAVKGLECTTGPDSAATLTALCHLATIYRDAGRLREAITLLERVRDAELTRLGPEHPDTLITLSNLARMYSTAGRLPEAIALLERVRDVLMARLGLDHPDTLTTLDNLAAAYKEAGKFQEAIALFERVRDAELTRFGPEHPRSLTTLNNLATAYVKVGRFQEAIALFERVRDGLIATLGPDHPDTLGVLGNLAGEYQRAGEYPEAIALFERVRDGLSDKLGPDHPDILATLHELARAYWSTHQLDKSVPLYEDVLKRREARLGPEHPDTLMTLSNLGVNYKDAGRLPEAIAVFERLRDARIATLGPDHPDTLDALTNLGSAYHGVGRNAEALAVFERVANLQIAKLGPDDPDTLRTIANVAALSWSMKQLDKSVPLFENVLRRREAKLGRQDVETQEVVANLGVNYKDAGRIKEAIPLLEEVHQSAKRYPRLHIFTGALIDAYAMAGERAKLLDLLQEELAEARKALPGDSPQVAGLLAHTAASLLEQGKWTEAEPLLRECLAIREKKEPDDWRTFNTKSMLGGALLGQKKYAEAESLLLAGYEALKRREASIPPQSKDRLSEALDRLVEFYTATYKPDELTKWQAERAKYPPARTAEKE